MTKIVINQQHGGFGLSPKAQKRYLELIGKECYFYQHDIKNYMRISIEDAENKIFAVTVIQDLGVEPDKIPNDAYWNDYDLERDDPLLIQVVNELGAEANGRFSNLVVFEIPDDVEWQVDDYDGWETIHEKHRMWG
jgi:hypothetical protein